MTSSNWSWTTTSLSRSSTGSSATRSHSTRLVRVSRGRRFSRRPDWTNRPFLKISRWHRQFWLVESTFEQLKDGLLPKPRKTIRKPFIRGAQQLTKDEGSYLPNCQKYLVIGLHALSILFCNFINTTAWHLRRCKPSSPSSKEAHGLSNERELSCRPHPFKDTKIWSECLRTTFAWTPKSKSNQGRTDWKQPNKPSSGVIPGQCMGTSSFVYFQLVPWFDDFA